MRFGSLFSGIGGLDLGFEAAGFTPAWFCEANPFGQAVLATHWPGVPCHPDVRTLSAASVDPVDLLIGGFPCQDVSDAGRRDGIGGARSGLWREFARLVGELRPRGVVVENVPGLFVRGIDVVLGDLAALGYDAEWTVIRAADVGAPHLRARVFIVAYPQRDTGRDEQQRVEPGAAGDGQESGETGGWPMADAYGDGLRSVGRPRGNRTRDARSHAAHGRDMADPDHGRQQRLGLAEPAGQRSPCRRESDGCRALRGEFNAEECGRPAQSGAATAADVSHPCGEGLPQPEPPALHGAGRRDEGRTTQQLRRAWPARPGEPQHAWEPPRVQRSARAQSALGADPDGVPAGMAGWRRAALEATGNAVVPQVAELVAWRVRELCADGVIRFDV